MNAEVNTAQSFIRFNPVGNSPRLFLEFCSDLAKLPRGREVTSVKLSIDYVQGDLFNPDSSYFQVYFKEELLPHMLKCADYINANK